VTKAPTAFAINWTAIAASSRPAIRVSTSMPDGRRIRTTIPEKRSTSQTATSTSTMATATAR
jgi:hypothetical protein